MKLVRESYGDVKLAKFVVFITENNYGYKSNFYPELPGFLFAETYIWNSRTKDDFESLEHRNLKIPFDLQTAMFHNEGIVEGGAVEYNRGKKSIYYHGYRSKLTPEQEEFVKGKIQLLVGRIEE